MARNNPSGRIGPTFLMAVPVVLGLAWGGVWWGPSFSGSADPGPVTTPAADAVTATAADAARTGAAEPEVHSEASVAMATAPAADERTPTPAELAAVRDLRATLGSLLPLDRWRSSRWSVLVTSLDRGDTLFARNAHETLTPASNLKLLTTAAALHHLGEGFRFRTFLLSDGRTADGRLEGDLVLYGTGDPTLGDSPRRPDEEPLRIMARQLRNRGIRVVDGDVVGDGSYFGEEIRPSGWGTRSLNEWFAAPIASLQYNENVATLRIRAGARAGGPVDVETVPEGAPVRLDIQAETVTRRTRHPVWAVRETLDEPVVLIGQQELDDREIWRRMPVPDPALYAATRLRIILEEEGIDVLGEVRSAPGGSRSMITGKDLWAPGMDGGSSPVVLAEHQSPPLLELLQVVNRESHNLYAESIGRALGRVVAGDPSFDGGARVIRSFLVDEIGVPADEARPLDGSGLSPDSRVSPYALVALLDHVYRGPHWEAFWSTLPEAGNWRQLRRMYRSPAAGNLRAKTGTLRTVSGLTGVVQARNGEHLAFSILSNDVPSTSMAKAVEDRIGIQLAAFTRPGGGSPLVASAPDPTRPLEE